MAAKQSLENQGNLQNLGKDLRAGLVDLGSVTFDQKAHDLAFTRSGVVLADEPERRNEQGGRRAED
jgi:hypothetical protein